MRILIITTIFIVVSIFSSTGQSYRPERPHVARSGYVLPINTFSLEFGSDVEVIDADHLGVNHAQLDLRIGMMKLMEMTFGFSLPGRWQPVDDPVVRSNGHEYIVGFASPKLGVKLTMKEKEEASKMAMAFFGSASLNLGSKRFKDTKVLPAFSVAMDIDWNERTNMRVNYGVVWKENNLVFDPEGNPVIDPFVLVALNVNGRLNDKLSMFGEFHALVKHNNFKSGYYMSGGWIVHLKDNVQLDISGGAGLSPESSLGMARIGFSGLWPKKNISWLADNE